MARPRAPIGEGTQRERSLGGRERLAVLRGDDEDLLGGVGVEQLAPAEDRAIAVGRDRPRTPSRAGRAPGGRRRRRRRSRGRAGRPRRRSTCSSAGADAPARRRDAAPLRQLLLAERRDRASVETDRRLRSTKRSDSSVSGGAEGSAGRRRRKASATSASATAVDRAGSFHRSTSNMRRGVYRSHATSDGYKAFAAPPRHRPASDTAPCPLVRPRTAAPRPVARFRLRVTAGEAIFVGPGKVALLEAIRDTRSITAAAKSIGMSYRRAWVLVDELNGSLASAAVESAIGGEHGGGSDAHRARPRADRRLPTHRDDRGARLREGPRPPARARHAAAAARSSASRRRSRSTP